MYSDELMNTSYGGTSAVLPPLVSICAAAHKTRLRQLHRMTLCKSAGPRHNGIFTVAGSGPLGYEPGLSTTSSLPLQHTVAEAAAAAGKRD